MGTFAPIQRNLSIKDTLNKGHLSNQDTVCSPSDIERCTNAHVNNRYLYTGQPAGPQWCPLWRGPTVKRLTTSIHWC